jgi:hypothetical protein
LVNNAGFATLAAVLTAAYLPSAEGGIKNNFSNSLFK